VLRHLLTASLVVLLPACSGVSCDELAGIQAERDARRASYTALVVGGAATEDEVSVAHDELHALEEQAYDLEQRCEG
jgi:hypothetical protein